MNRRFCAAFLVTFLLACGRAESASAPASRSNEPAAADASASERGAKQAAFAFTEADLDAYARGIAKEIELVKAAQERAANAKDANERGKAIQAQWETATVPEAAKLAGIDVERYRKTREAVHEVFKTLDFQGKIEGPLSIDLSRVDEETRKKLSRDPFNDLTPASAKALRAKMSQLVPLWSEYTTITAVAG